MKKESFTKAEQKPKEKKKSVTFLSYLRVTPITLIVL